MDTHNSMGKLAAREISRKANCEAGLQGAGTPLLMGSRGARRLSLVVVQGANALTASNRRTDGRGYPKGRECPLVMGVSGELEGSPDLVMQRPNGALALTDPDHLRTGLGKCQRLGMQRGRSAPCQDGLVQEFLNFRVLQGTSCGDPYPVFLPAPACCSLGLAGPSFPAALFGAGRFTGQGVRDNMEEAKASVLFVFGCSSSACATLSDNQHSESDAVSSVALLRTVMHWFKASTDCLHPEA